jgi:hypothetical protein
MSPRLGSPRVMLALWHYQRPQCDAMMRSAQLIGLRSLACDSPLPCFALLCLALPCFALLCLALPCFALPCFALLCFADCSLCDGNERVATPAALAQVAYMPLWRTLCTRQYCRVRQVYRALSASWQQFFAIEVLTVPPTSCMRSYGPCG